MRSVYAMTNGVARSARTLDVLELTSIVAITVTVTPQRINVLAAMDGLEAVVKFQIVKESPTVSAVDTVMSPLILLPAQTALKVGWVLVVEIHVFMDTRSQWIVEIAFAIQGGPDLVATANVLATVPLLITFVNATMDGEELYARI